MIDTHELEGLTTTLDNAVGLMRYAIKESKWDTLRVSLSHITEVQIGLANVLLVHDRKPIG